MREIEPKPSRRLGLLLAGMLLLAWVAVYHAALPVSLQPVLAVVVAGVTGWGWRRALPTVSLRIGADGRLECRHRQAAWHDAEILGDSFVSTALIVLRYRTAGGTVRTLTLLPDSADGDDLRRLRVSLRWARRTRSDTGFPDAD